MSFSQLQAFVTVADAGTVSRAATALRIAQPALSRQIRALEDELGAPLFARESRGMRLLPRGETLLGHARAILAHVERAASEVRQSSR